MTTTVATSTSTFATGYGNQRKADRTSNGVLWALHNHIANSSNQNAQLLYSTDNGATWASPATGEFILTPSGSVNNQYLPTASLFIDVDDYAHVAFKDRDSGQVFYTRGTPNAGRTAWTWSTAVVVTSVTAADYPDVIAHREGTGWAAHVVYSRNSDSSQSVGHVRVTITSGGVLTASAVTPLASATGYGVAAHTYPSIDFNHNGGGKTVAGGTPHLYVGWSAGITGSGKGIRFRKATYSGGSWTWGAEREISPSFAVTTATSWLNCLFDGTRVVLGGQFATADWWALWDRDAADTFTTERYSVNSAAARRNYGSLSYDGDGNLYVLGYGSAGAAGTRSLSYVKWTRSTGAVAETAFDSTGSDSPRISAKRGFTGNRIEWVYTDGTSSPYTVAYDSIYLNVPPNAPTLVSPIGNAGVDRAIVQRLSWSFSDPDPGDSQSKADVRYRLVGAGSWTDVLTAAATSPFWDAPASTFAAGSFEWQVRTYDATGAVGPYSGSEFFTATNAPAEPTIPAPVSGGTVSAESATVQWSTPAQDAYQVRTVADSSGTANTAVVYTDTGVVEGGSRSRSVAFATNNRNEHIQVRIRVGGLWSAWASIRVLVSYTRPAVPTLTLTTDDAAGALIVAVVNPVPGAGEPVVTRNQLRIRKTGETTVPGFLKDHQTGGAQIITPSGTFPWHAPAAKTDYEVLVTAFGDNGTTSESAWTGAATPEPIDPGGSGAGGYSGGY